MQTYFNYIRRKSSVVTIGSTPLGGEYPIRLQSMTNSSTMDTPASVEQSIRIIEMGGEYVRLTAQGVREAENLSTIRTELRARGFETPLVADIHFNSKAADAAAKAVEKVRINPGNYVDSVKTFSHFDYTDAEYQAELLKIRERFLPFLAICRSHGTAVRIGVNHGSLSDRIMSRYGDTPEGMVESCLEFLRLCIEEQFLNVVISMKASNTVVMVNSVRLLVERMNQEGMSFPLHLGVTEAGDGEDGRIKSAVGIGALLADGLGDTIRVSLSEEPELEIPVARKLVDYFTNRQNHLPIVGDTAPNFCWYSPEKRKSVAVCGIGGDSLPVVILEPQSETLTFEALRPDYILGSCNSNYPETPQIIAAASWTPSANQYPLFSLSELESALQTESALKFLAIEAAELTYEVIDRISQSTSLVLLLTSHHTNPVGDLRAAFHRLMIKACTLPVVIRQRFDGEERESLQLKAAADHGALYLGGLGDGIALYNRGGDDLETLNTMFGILQAARLRVSKTEYISCPSCGRTLFNLQRTIARIKERTAHLKGLKIGIMGCIVNGPGEMADADYGYVGAGRGKVSLYKRKECIERNIPEEEAVDKLVELIKQNGDWREEQEAQ